MSEAAREGSWSIRTKVRVALIAVLLLVLPQTALSIYYVSQISTTAALVSIRAALVVDVRTVRRGVDSLSLPPTTLAISESVADRYLGTLDRLLEIARAAAKRHTAHEAELSHVAGGLSAVRKAAADLFRFVKRARESVAGATALEQLLAGQGPEGGVDVGPLREALTFSLRDVDERMDAVLIGVYDELRGEQVFAQRVVDHADRHLISLTMLTCGLVLALFFLLPGRLVAPIRRLTRAVDNAGAGVMEAPLTAPSDDEVGKLGAALFATLETLRRFDDAKRQRIVEDGAKVSTLLAMLPRAVAILDDRFRIQQCNHAFSQLFGALEQIRDTPAPRLVSDGDALRRMLVHNTQARGATEAVELEVPDASPSRWLTRAVACRDRRGAATHLILALEPISPQVIHRVDAPV